MNYNEHQAHTNRDSNSALPGTHTLGSLHFHPRAPTAVPPRVPTHQVHHALDLDLDLDALFGSKPPLPAADAEFDLDALLRDALAPLSALSSPPVPSALSPPAALPLSPVPSLEPVSPHHAPAHVPLDIAALHALPHVELTHATAAAHDAAADMHALLGTDWISLLGPPTFAAAAAPATASATLDAALACATAAAAVSSSPHAPPALPAVEDAGALLAALEWPSCLTSSSAHTNHHDVPALEPSPPIPPPPPAKKPRRTAVSTTTTATVAPLLPPVIRLPAGPEHTATVIPTATRKSKPKPGSCLPAVLAYPRAMVAHDAPIASNPRKRGRDAANLDHHDAPAELPSDPALVPNDPRAQKRITNALSARRSRARKEATLAYLETKVEQLERERAMLEAQLADLAAQLVAGGAVAGP